MPDHNETLIRSAYAAYLRGDFAALLELVHPDLEWTYLDPGFADPPPQTCHGRGEFESALLRQAKAGFRSRLDEVIANGDEVVVATHTPGIDATRVRQNDDRNYDVFTVRDDRITTIRACRDRAEALAIAGVRE